MAFQLEETLWDDTKLAHYADLLWNKFIALDLTDDSATAHDRVDQFDSFAMRIISSSCTPNELVGNIFGHIRQSKEDQGIPSSILVCFRVLSATAAAEQLVDVGQLYKRDFESKSILEFLQFVENWAPAYVTYYQGGIDQESFLLSTHLESATICSGANSRKPDLPPRPNTSHASRNGHGAVLSPNSVPGYQESYKQRSDTKTSPPHHHTIGSCDDKHSRMWPMHGKMQRSEQDEEKALIMETHGNTFTLCGTRRGQLVSCITFGLAMMYLIRQV